MKPARTPAQVAQQKKASAYRQYKGILALMQNLRQNPEIDPSTRESLEFCENYLSISHRSLRLHLGFKPVIFLKGNPLLPKK